MFNGEKTRRQGDKETRKRGISFSLSPCLPFSLSSLLVFLACCPTILAQDQSTSRPPEASTVTSGQVQTAPNESRNEVKKLWSDAEDLRATGAVESIRAAMS